MIKKKERGSDRQEKKILNVREEWENVDKGEVG